MDEQENRWKWKIKVSYSYFKNLQHLNANHYCIHILFIFTKDETNSYTHDMTIERSDIVYRLSSF